MLTKSQAKNIFMLFLGMYLFVWSLSGMKESWALAFAVEGKENLAKEYVSRMTDNPLSGLCLGIVATALVQSSSGVVAVAITTVAAGGMTVSQAIPLIMGANIGTTVTCVLVTLGYSVRRKEFALAMPVALLNDVVKTLTVGIFFVLEYFTGFLSILAIFLSEKIGSFPIFNFFLNGFPDFLDIIIEPLLKPVISFVLLLSKGSMLGAIALGVFSFVILIIGLEWMGNSAERAIKGTASEYVNSAFKTKRRGLFLGTSFASLLQSSSVATSLSIPFVASGKINIKQAYPYLLGCNIGTTIDPGQIASYLKFGIMGLNVGMVHILLNVLSVIIWLFIPNMEKIPFFITNKITGYILSTKKPYLTLIFYTILVFFIIPLSILYFI